MKIAGYHDRTNDLKRFNRTNRRKRKETKQELNVSKSLEAREKRQVSFPFWSIINFPSLSPVFDKAQLVMHV